MIQTWSARDKPDRSGKRHRRDAYATIFPRFTPQQCGRGLNHAGYSPSTNFCIAASCRVMLSTR